MIFTYLLVVSVLVIIVLIIIEHRKTGQSLLQMFKKLCSIDSVRFEDNLEKTQKHSLKLGKHVSSFGEKHISKLSSHAEAQGNKFRSYVRKKLHPETKKTETSSFIKHIKEE